MLYIWIPADVIVGKIWHFYLNQFLRTRLREALELYWGRHSSRQTDGWVGPLTVEGPLYVTAPTRYQWSEAISPFAYPINSPMFIIVLESSENRFLEIKRKVILKDNTFIAIYNTIIEAHYFLERKETWPATRFVEVSWIYVQMK